MTTEVRTTEAYLTLQSRQQIPTKWGAGRAGLGGAFANRLANVLHGTGRHWTVRGGTPTIAYATSEPASGGTLRHLTTLDDTGRH